MPDCSKIAQLLHDAVANLSAQGKAKTLADAHAIIQREMGSQDFTVDDLAIHLREYAAAQARGPASEARKALAAIMREAEKLGPQEGAVAALRQRIEQLQKQVTRGLDPKNPKAQEDRNIAIGQLKRARAMLQREIQLERNRIAKLEKLKGGKPLRAPRQEGPKTKRVAELDAEIKALEAKRDKGGREQARVAALKKEIADLESGKAIEREPRTKPERGQEESALRERKAELLRLQRESAEPERQERGILASEGRRAETREKRVAALKKEIAEREAGTFKEPERVERDKGADTELGALEEARARAQSMDRMTAELEKLRGELASGAIVPRPSKQARALSDKEYATRARLMAARAAMNARIEGANDTPAKKAVSVMFRGIPSVARALKAGVDFSTTLMQNLLFTVSHPVSGPLYFGRALRAGASRGQYLKLMEQEIESDPWYRAATTGKVKLGIDKPEGFFDSDLAERIPLIREVTGFGDRFARTFAGQARMKMLRESMRWAAHKKNAPTSQEMDAIKRSINILTGYGDFGKHEQAANLLNDVFFGARFNASLFQRLAMWQNIRPFFTKGESTAYSQAMITGHLVKGLVGSSVLIGMLVAAGFELDDNPDSNTYLHLKVPGTERYIDVSGGLAGPISLINDLLFRKGDSYQKFNRLAKFTRYKLSPLYGLGASVAVGETPDRKKASPQHLATHPMDAAKLVGEQFAPMNLETIYEVAREKYGLDKKIMLSIFSVFGLNPKERHLRKR